MSVKKYAPLCTAAVVVAFVGVLIASPLHAGLDQLIKNQLNPIENVYDPADDVTDQSLPKAVAEIIRIALGLLGIIFLALIVYAGFMWMTSAGNEDRIQTAKKIMVAAIIGTAIILCAYIITIFVIESLTEATITN